MTEPTIITRARELLRAYYQSEPLEARAEVLAEELAQLGLKKLRAALAEPAPEDVPVAWMYIRDDEDQVERRVTTRRWSQQSPLYSEVPLYTAPPRREWQGLTEPDIHAAYDWPVGWGYDNVRDFAFALEAVLRSKNT